MPNRISPTFSGQGILLFLASKLVPINPQWRMSHSIPNGGGVEVVTTRELVCRLIRNDMKYLNYRLTKLTARR